MSMTKWISVLGVLIMLLGAVTYGVLKQRSTLPLINQNLATSTMPVDTSTPNIAAAQNGRCLNDSEKAVMDIVKIGPPTTLKVSVINIVSSTTLWSNTYT